MSRCLLYTYNPAAGAVAAGENIPTGSLGSIVRRHGCAASPSLSGIQLTEEGYYKIFARATVTAEAAGTLTLTLRQDGTAVPGATVSAAAAAAGDEITLELPAAAVRVLRCPCGSVLTFALTGGAATASTLSVLADKD